MDALEMMYCAHFFIKVNRRPWWRLFRKTLMETCPKCNLWSVVR